MFYYKKILKYWIYLNSYNQTTLSIWGIGSGNTPLKFICTLD